jgi:threonine dehydratase
MPLIDRQGIAKVHAVIAPFVRATPTLELDGSGLVPGVARLALKLEALQHAGSFKARGAFANLLTRELPPAGVVAASGGNHGAAVAYAAMRLGVKARIFVPVTSSPAKVARIRSYGAELTVEGAGYAEALELSRICVAETGALAVHAFDQVETMLGTGTVAR